METSDHYKNGARPKSHISRKLKPYIMRKVFLITFVACASLLSAQVPSNVPTDSLSAWYSFNESTNDASGNNNHLLGTVSYVSGQPYTDWAVTNFQASAPLSCDTPSFIFGRDSSFTLSCWVKPTDSDFGGLIAKHWNQVSSDDFVWYFGLNNSSITFACQGDNSNSWTRCKYEEGIPVDSLVNLVIIYDSGSMKLFLNTELVASGNFTGGATTNQLKFRVGFDGWNNSVLTDVVVDEMGIWNRVLDSTERQHLYASHPVGVNNLIAENKISVYPNPSNGKIFVENTTKRIAFKDGEIRIYNLYGEKIYSDKIKSDKIQIDLDNIAAGLYLIEIHSGQTIITKKILIE